MANVKTIRGRWTHKGQDVPNLTEDQARAHIEKLMWPDGQPVCRHCGSVDAYKMQGATCRPGLCRCRDCEKQFTVTVGTIFEDSHIPLAKWVRAIHLMSSSKKGISALQLQRNLGLGSYRSAWFMAHRIRLAMRCEPAAGLLKGDVQVDEAYIGPNRHGRKRRAGEPERKRGRGTEKHPVLVLVETNGKAHSQPIDRIDARTLRAAMKERIDPSARIVTDELSSYPPAAKGFAGGHQTVCHSAEEYVNKDGFHTNTAESYIGLFKRGIVGAFHHISRKHLHRYCAEFDFRWNTRTISDVARRDEAVKGAEGKRLYYRSPVNPPTEQPHDGEQLPIWPE